MSDAGKPPTSGEARSGDVEARARALNDKLAALMAESRTLKRSGRLMALLVAIAAVGGAYLLLSPMLSAYKNPEPYQEAFKVELQRQVIPALGEESQALLKSVGPDIMQSIRDNTARRLPEITTKLESEGRELAMELSTAAGDKLTARSEKLMMRLEKTLAAEIPQAADPAKSQVIVENGHKAAQGAIDRFLKTYLAEHMDGVSKLQERIETFPVPQNIAAMSDDELREHLTQTMGVYATRQMSAARSPQLAEFLNSLNQAQPTKGE